MEIEKIPALEYIYSGNLGGYPMVNIIQKEIDKQNLLGGKTNNTEIGISRFDNLIIPAGLVSFSNDYYSKTIEVGGSQDKKQIKEKINGAIDNELFNKVFDLITKCPGKTRTKKNLEKHLRNTNIKNTKKRIMIQT